ncbi:MAG: sulfatase [Acidobacteriota bacterium]|nr:sulfatase [Acidobacteriota bacterium]
MSPILVALLMVASSSAGGGAPPSFIVFVADDMAWNDAGAYGHPHIRTPNIDRLARDGMRFDRAFLTTSSCSPSRSSILTGRYPHSTGAAELHLPLPASQVIVTEPLRDLGYYTAAAGKWHLGDATRPKFDLVVGGGAGGSEEWSRVLRERPRDQPFFFWFAANDPHRDYEEGIIAVPHGDDDVVVPPFLPDNAATRADLRLYYDEIARLDGAVGHVLAELEQQGAAENTFVLFLSDNGRPFPRSKTTLYDSGIRTPFIVRLPGVAEAGSTTASLISAVDIAPTILDLAGLDPLDSHQGRSFAGILESPRREHREHVFAERNWHDYAARARSVRTKRHLYVRNEYNDLSCNPPRDAVRSITYRAMVHLHRSGQLPPEQSTTFLSPRPEEELYDLEFDAFSLHNLASLPVHAATLAELRAVLGEWQKDTDDVAPATRRPDLFDRTSGEWIEERRIEWMRQREQAAAARGASP